MGNIRQRIRLRNVKDLEQLPIVLELLTKQNHTAREWKLLSNYFMGVEVEKLKNNSISNCN